eukprot:Tamp_05728.p1 GENE.Tamp_05728~~Tamp_05728.p1  ORF type:complete len:565 (-),score=62.61 Tamp_05728:1199-2668(-)
MPPDMGGGARADRPAAMTQPDPAPSVRAFEPPQDAKLVRAQVLLKKEPQYPYAWKPHKAYLYSNGVLIFVHHDAKADKAGAQDAELSGRSTVRASTRVKITSKSVVLSPSLETFKVGDRGHEEDTFCTCQGNSPRDREEWVDDISRIILKLQGDDVPRFGKQGRVGPGAMGDHFRNPRSGVGPETEGKFGTSVGGQENGGVQRSRNWHEEYPTDEDSDESDSSSAFGDGHYRLKPKTPRTRGAEAREKAAGEDQPHGRKPLAEGAGTGGRKEREWPLGDDATENDLTLASNVPRLLVQKAARGAESLADQHERYAHLYDEHEGSLARARTPSKKWLDAQPIAEAIASMKRQHGENTARGAADTPRSQRASHPLQEREYADMIGRGKWVRVPMVSPATPRAKTARNPQIPQLEREALETLMSANVSEHHERKEDLDQMKKRCCGVCTPAEHEWWKTEGMKYIILALFLMTIALLGVGIMEAMRPREVEPD